MSKRSRPSEMPSINLKVKSQDGQDLYFKIRSDTKFIKLFTAYCDKRQYEYRTIQFFHEGQRILGSHTPARLNMEDNDEIEAMTHALGGGCSSI
ncbi:small ubiquitin-related modifier 2-like [Quercus robur]|uniref:small ubiquitin-related modifier 2-like n=1 Tax=Quercus robur TaxID=38942 RepID=UPI0021616DC0|nr:small ubiquitin-related modifier 2-like [Quercus robur]